MIDKPKKKGSDRPSLVAYYPLDRDGSELTNANAAMSIVWSNNSNSFLVDNQRGNVFHPDIEPGRSVPRCLTTKNFKSVKLFVCLIDYDFDYDFH